MPELRRQTTVELNKGEARNALARAVCFRGAHITARCQTNRQLGHRIAVGHFEHENDIILTSRHIAADQPTAQSRDLGLEGFVSRCHAFDPSRALVGPIQKADEKHGSPPFSKFTNAASRKLHASFECVETTRPREDNTMQRSGHAERPADSEARVSAALAERRIEGPLRQELQIRAGRMAGKAAPLTRCYLSYSKAKVSYSKAKVLDRVNSAIGAASRL